MSRPAFKATEDQRKLVRSLAAIGIQQERIAVAVGMRSPKTLRKHFAAEIAKGNAEAMTALMSAAYEMAVSGSFPGVTRFWLSTMGSAPDFPSDSRREDGSDDAED